MRSLIVIALLLLCVPVSACKVVPATSVNNVYPPETIPKCISQHYSDLCGYFTCDGYFANIVELDAFYRWKYPELYDPRIYDFLYKDCDGSRCVNEDFLKRYWNDKEGTRAWLRNVWKYPRDWREIIPVSKMLYIEGGKNLKALDRDVAITPELIKKAKQKYGNVKIEASSVAVSSVSTVSGIPSYYTSIIEKYSTIRDLALEALGNPITWSFAGLMALIVLLAGSNAALAVALSRMQKTQTAEFKFFRRID